jgi:hypothetical protein
MDSRVLATILIMAIAHRRRRREMRTRVYMRAILAKRITQGEHFLVKDMENDQKYFYDYFRMSKESFQKVLTNIWPRIDHKKTHRVPISPAQRLAVTLRSFVHTIKSYFHLHIERRTSPFYLRTL